MAADPALIATWIRAWTITRGVGLPIAYRSGHYVDVGQPDQRSRYVFAELEEPTIRELGATIQEPWIYIKVCESDERVRALLPPRWEIRTPPTYMMTADLAETRAVLPPGYRLSTATEGALRTASIIAAEGVVARGRMVIADGVATFDQIRTDEAHQRLGLGRAIMAALSRAALRKGAATGALCATAVGRALYESIGWTVHAPYSSAVIPSERAP